MTISLKVGTRGSKLAIVQTQIALAALRKSNRSIECEIVTITTRGDVDKRPIFTIDQKGIFEKELNDAVMKGSIDFAVHSLKDLPSDLNDELILASIPKRARPNDVLVNKKKLKLSDLPKGSIVGTSSLRRAIQIIRRRPDLNVKPIRGNVETRIKKSINGEYDAVVVAEAGLIRLGMKDVIVERFNIRDFMPSPGQGAIAIVCRKNNHQLIRLLKSIEDKQSRAEVDAEREMSSKIEGGCRFPVGAIAVTSSDRRQMTLYASVFSADGIRSINLQKSGSIKNPRKLGTMVAEMLIKEDVLKLSEDWHNAMERWNKK
ncbi:MAG TPA: hydroxymethylbilane synthase [Nitrososphaeraceae archaeon]|nr:hydroxymethylbilane synthase [Nitrososphaeraceae archaeon]